MLVDLPEHVIRSTRSSALDSDGEAILIAGPQGNATRTCFRVMEGRAILSDCPLLGIKDSNESASAVSKRYVDGKIHQLEAKIKGCQGPAGFQGPASILTPAPMCSTPAAVGGVQGRRGRSGQDGSDGSKGQDGTQGPQGIDGPQGRCGGSVRGPQGADGLRGAQGADGSSGARGVQGMQGDAGRKGRRGAQGSQGTNGPQGNSGMGLSGPQGWQGDIGLRGEEGRAGDPGPQGFFGAQGIFGEPGEPGSQGFQGVSGPAGLSSTSYFHMLASPHRFVSHGDFLSGMSSSSCYAPNTQVIPVDGTIVSIVAHLRDATSLGPKHSGEVAFRVFVGPATSPTFTGIEVRFNAKRDLWAEGRGRFAVSRGDLVSVQFVGATNENVCLSQGCTVVTTIVLTS